MNLYIDEFIAFCWYCAIKCHYDMYGFSKVTMSWSTVSCLTRKQLVVPTAAGWRKTGKKMPTKLPLWSETLFLFSPTKWRSISSFFSFHVVDITLPLFSLTRFEQILRIPPWKFHIVECEWWVHFLLGIFFVRSLLMTVQTWSIVTFFISEILVSNWCSLVQRAAWLDICQLWKISVIRKYLIVLTLA